MSWLRGPRDFRHGLFSSILGPVKLDPLEERPLAEIQAAASALPTLAGWREPRSAGTMTLSMIGASSVSWTVSPWRWAAVLAISFKRTATGSPAGIVAELGSGRARP